MFELFQDIFAYRDSPWMRLDPRSKMIVALATILCILLSTRMILPLAVLALSLGVMSALPIPFKLLSLRLAGPMGIVMVLLILESFSFGSTELMAITIRGWRLSATREGLFHGLLMGSKVLGSLSVMLLLSSVTPAHKVFSALRWFRIPEGWVEIAMLMYRYTFTLLEHAADVAAAQKVRLGYLGIKRSLSSVGTLAGTVIIRSIDQAAHTHEAMIMRGYTGIMPFGPMPPLPARELWTTIGACGVVMTAFLMLESGRFW